MTFKDLVQLLIDNYPTIAGYVVFGLLIGLCVHFYHKFNNRICKLEQNDFNGLETKLETKINGVETKINRLLEKFNSLIVALSESQIISNSALFTINSPIQLTEEGKKLLEKVGWSEIINNENNKQYFFNKIEKRGAKNKYSIEKNSIIIINDLMSRNDKDILDPIRKYLYEHAEIDDTSVFTACGIDLRDKYFEIHPEIKE